ncbi:MAG: pyridoxal-phosphate dependent enzyme [Acidimicrobiia bacterium]|nr:pyridoxal-phosphate dependent enzyme [Acidimicrobiia bacterium]
MSWLANPGRDPGWRSESVPGEVQDFHRALAGYAPTRLVELPDLAAEFGVRRVCAKEESTRLGLPAFKALGASWAIRRALSGSGEGIPADGPCTLVTATDGNHGRAVAHFAGQLGHHAEIFVPAGVHPTAIQAIRDEGAIVTVVHGSYDDAVHAAKSRAQQLDRGVLIQDTAWVGYEDIPGWIVDGYSTLFVEIDAQLSDLGVTGPDLVVVPTGVGSLLQAAIAHYRADVSRHSTAIVSVEPVGAACVMSSVAAGRPVTVPTGETVLAGLNCGTMSSLAWPHVVRGLDGCVVVADGAAIDAMRDLAAAGVDAGPCGAASLAALRALHEAGNPLRLGPESTVVLLITEGAEANPLPEGGDIAP